MDFLQSELLNNRESKREDKLTSAFLWVIIVLLLIFIVMRGLVFSTVNVSGDSMLPTLESGDYVYGNRLYAMLGIYERGDVVVIDTDFPDLSSGHSKKIIKRIIAVEGDKVDIRGGLVYVNDVVLEESYLYPETSTEPRDYSFPYTVMEDEIFVLGDNRPVSKDSRSLDYKRISTSDVFAVVSDWAIEHKTKENKAINCVY